MQNTNKETIEILDTTLKQGFSQIPRTVLRASNLTMQAKTLYALLLDYAWQKGSCFPGQNRLGKDLGVHRNTIQKYLLELRDFGLIKWDRRGFKQTNIYYILSLDFLIDQQSDAQERVHQDAQSCVQPDAQGSVHKVEEVEYKKKEYKKPLTLSLSTSSGQDNDNGEINLNSFDSEAIALAEEFNDLKSIKFYQGIINKRNRGEISDDDIQSALEDTRRVIRTDQVDGTDFLKNPAGWFVSVLNKLIGKRQEKEQKEKVSEMLSEFKESFMNKTKI
ncbi:helix-turn-helix domain-containing protein [Candidatus Nomurabacteria bacterium]|nr:helix-turn-helix domain-containing protein [Candidatus Nomurabacteria bacterium]